jgi:hypothetical protein
MTIEGTSSRSKKKKRRSSSGQKAHQRRFKAAAKKCKGLPGTKFRACMRRELKR